MLDKVIILIAEYITQYTKPTTVYKTLLLLIVLAWLLYPLCGSLPIEIAITIAIVVWLVTEFLYVVAIDNEEESD